MLLTRYLWVQKYGSIDATKELRHICDNPACINMEHLLLGTHQDNMDDMRERNREIHPTGAKARNKTTKLKLDDIPQIRYMLAEGFRQSYIGELYGVNRVTITDINMERSWKEVN